MTGTPIYRLRFRAETRALLALALAISTLLFATGNARCADKEIRLGMSAAFSGPSRGLGIELFRGANAYFQYVNEQGGVNGKDIRVIPLDDGYNPIPAIENTIHFMDDPRILCLFNYVGTPTTTRILPLFKSSKANSTFLFFPFTGAQAFRSAPYKSHIYNLRASYEEEVDGIINNFIKINRNRIAVFYQADAYGRSGWQGIRKALADHDKDIVAEATYRRGTQFTDSMAAQAEIIMRGYPDAVIAVGSYAACAAFIRDARDLGLDVPIANLSFVGSENLLAKLRKAGAQSGKDYTKNLINSQVVPSYNNTSLEAVRLYRKLMASNSPQPPRGYGKGYRPLMHSYVSFEGFLDAMVMTEIIRNLGSRDRRELPKVLASMDSIDIGIGVPVKFGFARHQGLNQVFFTTVEHGSFVDLEDGDWEQWRK